MKDAIHPAPVEFSTTQLSDDPILRYFHYSHLPPQLQSVSATFCGVAFVIVSTLPRNPERTVALRKLLEAKDAAVRANVPPATPETFFDRLKRERGDLHTKLTSLSVFIDSLAFEQIADDQKPLLIEQRTYMTNYLEILDQRIAGLEADDDANITDRRGENVDVGNGREGKITGPDTSETEPSFMG